MLEYLPTRRSAGGSCCLAHWTQSSMLLGICRENSIASQLHPFPPFFLSFIPFSAHFGAKKSPSRFFTPPHAPEMLPSHRRCRHLWVFFSFVFASNVLAFPVPLVFSLPHCATFIPLIFLLVNGPPRREDYPTAIINADVCTQTMAGNEECS